MYVIHIPLPALSAEAAPYQQPQQGTPQAPTAPFHTLEEGLLHLTENALCDYAALCDKTSLHYTYIHRILLHKLHIIRGRERDDLVYHTFRETSVPSLMT